MPGALVRLLVVFAVTVAAGPASAQLCGPTDDPCVATGDVTLSGGATIDLGGRDLVLGGSCTVTVEGLGVLSIVAGDITLEPGAKIVAPGTNGVGGSVTLHASGAVVMGANSRIDTTGGYAGDVAIVADRAQLDGAIRAEATTRDGDGGYVTLITTNDASIGGGGVDANGGDRDGFGGYFDAIVGGDLHVTARLEAKGGEGSDLYLDAAGDLLIHPGAELNAMALTPLGDGGSVSLNAGGLASVEGPVFVDGAGDWYEGGGDGGDFDIIADRALVDAPIELEGGHPDGSGGFFDVFATADVVLAGSVRITGPAQGLGGDVLVDTLGPITMTGSIDASGGYIGGSVDLATRGTFALEPGAVVNVGLTPGATFGSSGVIAIDACDATLAGTLDASGRGTAPRAIVRASVGGALTVSGVVEAPGGVTFRYRSVPPTITAAASIMPAPAIVQDATLPCCVLCTTTTSTSSTTSTTEAAPTTTSTTATTVTTSTTTTTTITTTSTTTVTSTTATSSSSSSSSSTVTTSTSSTTATTLPLSCLEEPLEGYAAVECAMTELQVMVAAQSEIALGGRRSAKRLVGKVAKSRDLVEKSRTSSKAVKLLVKAEKKVSSFEIQIAKLLAGAKIEDGLANELLVLSGEVTVRIEGVRTPLAN